MSIYKCYTDGTLIDLTFYFSSFKSEKLKIVEVIYLFSYLVITLKYYIILCGYGHYKIKIYHVDFIIFLE